MRVAIKMKMLLFKRKEITFDESMNTMANSKSSILGRFLDFLHILMHGKSLLLEFGFTKTLLQTMVWK